MRRMLLLLLVPVLALAADVPAGSLVSARLLSPVSSARVKRGEPVQVVITTGDLKGTRLSGRIAQTSRAEPNKRALLKIECSGAEIVDVDNARESVDSEGRIVGILAAETLAGVLRSLGVVFTRDANPEIEYPTGTDLILKLTRSIPVSEPSVNPTVAPDLVARIQEFPVRTVAQSPRAPSDITNILFLGSREDLTKAFADSGWTPARTLTASSVLETAIAIIEARGFHEAPVSTLLLNGRYPDFVFQRMTNTFAERHHIRIWRLEDGTWIGAATHDTGIVFAADERAFYHSIDPYVDKERDKIVSDLVFGGYAVWMGNADRPAAPRRTRNATGDQILTDGHMAVVHVGVFSRP